MDNFAGMTAQQKVKALVLLRARAWKAKIPAITASSVDDLYSADDYQDARNEVREGDEKTELPTKEFSRHYESDEVAAQLPDGSWVGWTHWHGGGKLGEPEAIDWISGAYHLNCKEEQKMVTVREFTKLAAVGEE